MVKRTLHFANPTYLSCRKEQLVIEYPGKLIEPKKIPIEDIGLMILENRQITITNYLLSKLLENNVAVVNCDANHHPQGMFLNLVGNSIQTQRFRVQIEAKLPLKKRLWAQTIKRKINNQSKVLEWNGKKFDRLTRYANEVKSGDSGNSEGKAAAYYWNTIFSSTHPDFIRGRFEEEPNNLLNYGYAIIRACIARNIVGAGLLPSLGINHKSKYNAYCLADDLMEPYRPFVDRLVADMVNKGYDNKELASFHKKEFLLLLQSDVWIREQKSPLMNATQISANSLVKCFEGKADSIDYPQFIDFE